MHRLTACVRGRVQGVAFRYYTQKEARRLGLAGWVRNEVDGSVSVVADGNKEHLAALLEFLHHGPDSADVHNVEKTWSVTSQNFSSFEIR